ncbi:OmpA family protein [Hydrogenophaga sp. R2]|uniref:OmpA family protein n=1 Tax=Hydrogenophaga sp. R2 TaxID=3132827 RepID=UPI003CFAF4E3
MASQDNDQDVRVAFAVIIAIVVLLVGSVVGIGIQRAGAPKAAKPAVAAPAAAGTVVVEDASVVVENGVVKFYFAVGQADLAPGAVDALAEAIAAAQAGNALAISGFHDATGSVEANEELAKRRAQAVRDVLAAAGVKPESLQLRKPEVTTGTGNNAEARRVEVSIVR